MGRMLTSSLVLAAVLAIQGTLGAGCGTSTPPEPEPLLVPWDQLSGRIAYLRGYEEIMLIDATARTVRRVYKAPTDHWVRDVAWGPGTTYLTATMMRVYPVVHWWLAKIDVRTGSSSEIWADLDEASYASWSTGGTIAFHAGAPGGIGGLYVDGVLVPQDVAVPAALNASSWSPDGSTLAVVQDNTSNIHGVGDLVLLDVGASTVSRLGPVNAADPWFSPDGTRIAFTHYVFVAQDVLVTQLSLVSVPGGVESHLSAADAIEPSHPAWSPDGSRLVVQGGGVATQAKLYLVDPATGATTQLTSGTGYAPAWAP